MEWEDEGEDATPPSSPDQSKRKMVQKEEKVKTGNNVADVMLRKEEVDTGTPHPFPP